MNPPAPKSLGKWRPSKGFLFCLALIALPFPGYYGLKFYKQWDQQRKWERYLDEPANVPTPLDIGRMVELREDVVYFDCTFSPDGQQIALLLFNAERTNYWIEFRDLEGELLDTWEPDTVEPSKLAQDIIWPYPEKLYYLRPPSDPPRMTLFEVGLTSGEVKPMAPIPLYTFFAGFQNDTLYFARHNAGSATFYALSAETGEFIHDTPWRTWPGKQGEFQLSQLGKTIGLKPEHMYLQPNTENIAFLPFVMEEPGISAIIGIHVPDGTVLHDEGIYGEIDSGKIFQVFNWNAGGDGYWVGSKDHELIHFTKNEQRVVERANTYFSIREVSETHIILGGYRPLPPGITNKEMRERRSPWSTLGRPYLYKIPEGF